MKLLKSILATILILVGIFYVVGLFLPSEVRVERSIIIEAPVDEVFDEVATLQNWLKWNPWSKMDPQAKNEFTGPPSGPGATWHWSGETVGKGYVETIAIIPSQSIRSNLVFTSPTEAESIDEWTFEQTAQGVQVTWANETQLGYPSERYIGLMLDKIMGTNMMQGLESLRDYLETEVEPDKASEENIPSN